MTLTAERLEREVDTDPIEHGDAGDLIRIRSDDSGPNYSGFEVITVKYDPDAEPQFTARYTDIMGSNEVASDSNLDGILEKALCKADTIFIGTPKM